MKGRWILTVCTLFSCVTPLQAGVWEKVKEVCGIESQPKAPTVKVLIGKELEGALVEVRGKYNIYDPYKNDCLGLRFFSKRNYMQPVVEGLKWGEVFPGVYQIVIVPDTINTTIIVNGIEYKGSVYIYHVDNTINIVNEVPVEDYVHSVLAAQFMNPSHSQEVMAAMAIAARTDACYQAANNPTAYWHVDAEKVGYTGYASTKRADSNLCEVMASTRHLILSRTRAYEGKIVPIHTACLEKEFKGNNGKGWNSSRAETLASKGDNAAQILADMYPEGVVEMMTSLEQAYEKPSKKQVATNSMKRRQKSEQTE